MAKKTQFKDYVVVSDDDCCLISTDIFSTIEGCKGDIHQNGELEDGRTFTVYELKKVTRFEYCEPKQPQPELKEIK